MLDRTVYVTAHRGSSRAAPENSLSAIEKAIEHGADYAEIDVQEAGDGTIVVLHDVDLQRVAGVPSRVWELGYDEIGALDAGSWFAPEFAGERIPTLEEMLEQGKGRIRFNIELKFHGREQRFVERVVEIIEAAELESQCVLTSLDFDGLMQVRRLEPELQIGFIVSASVGDIRSLPVDFLSLQATNLSKSLVRDLHARDRDVHVWSVNDPNLAARMISMGADNIITDEPAMIRALIDERNALSPAEKLLFKFHALFMR
jgi:glycerophosphoryl diester phosphodiesterase